MKYMVIYRHKDKYSIREMCRFFGVSRSGYYGYVSRMDIPAWDLSLAKKIRECQEEYGRTYGYRRVHIWLERHNIYRNPKTVLRVMQKYGLLGYPLGHSFSKTYFNQKFEAEKIDAEYLNFEIPSIKEIKNVIKENPELNGLNVTIPYKEQVIPYLDDLDDDARQIGAVNVIKFTKGLFGKLKLKGYNSDIIGFKQSIDPLLKETHRKALILGTGGASKAVFHGLKQLGVGATLVSRKPKEFCITYDEITPKTMEQYTVIVNTTPLGMFPNIDSCPDIPYDLLTPNHLLYDLLYNPDETLFMKKGKEKGAIVKNGLEMLLLQAFAAWEIWQK